MKLARALIAVTCALTPLGSVLAHGVSEAAKQRMIDGGPLDFAWAGAEHMLTGYDHLLFLLGALFLLPRFLDILKFATTFTLGHTITLLGATSTGVRIDHFLIDGFIALTVIYIGARNLIAGRSRALNVPLLPLVFLFGLIHGFGLSTGMQEMMLPGDPTLTGKLLAFNVGVEGGQIAALAVIAALLGVWRASLVWPLLKRLTNVGIVAAGAVLFVVQLHGFASEPARIAGPNLTFPEGYARAAIAIPFRQPLTLRGFRFRRRHRDGAMFAGLLPTNGSRDRSA